MENPVSDIFCNVCQTRLKRQILGSNIFYYCRNCGCLSSEASFSKNTDELQTQEPVPAQRIITAQKTIIEA